MNDAMQLLLCDETYTSQNEVLQIAHCKQSINKCSIQSSNLLVLNVLGASVYQSSN